MRQAGGTLGPDQAAVICEAVRRHLQQQAGPHDAADLAALADAAADAIVSANVGAVEQDDLETVVAMCWLGPGREVPPEGMRERVLDLARRYRAVDDRSKLLDLVAAYGCGWGRCIPASGAAAWEAEWPGAFTHVVRIIRRVVGQCYRHFAGYAPGFPASADHLSAADRIYAVLTRPTHQVAVHDAVRVHCEPDGTATFSDLGGEWTRCAEPGCKAVLSVPENETGWLIARDADIPPLPLLGGTRIRLSAKDFRIHVAAAPPYTGNEFKPWQQLEPGEAAEIRACGSLHDWSCACGRYACARHHRIQSWSPEVKLSRFLETAVKGPDLHFKKISAMEQGMLVALLAREGI
jgi:hypothetical protein